MHTAVTGLVAESQIMMVSRDIGTPGRESPMKISCVAEPKRDTRLCADVQTGIDADLNRLNKSGQFHAGVVAVQRRV